MCYFWGLIDTKLKMMLILRINFLKKNFKKKLILGLSKYSIQSQTNGDP